MSQFFPPPPPPPRPPEPRRRGNSIWVGLASGMLALGLFGAAAAALTFPAWFNGIMYWLPFLAYIVAAIILAARPTTSRFGSGLLLAIGAWLVIGAGLCVALLSGLGR
jgi:ABC-type uncharacterized transport system permease subunit